MNSTQVDRLLPFILYFCDETYRILHPEGPPSVEDAELYEALKLAASNKLHYHLSKRIVEEGYSSHHFLKNVISKGDMNLQRQRDTLNFVHGSLEDIGRPLIIKSYKGLPYPTLDIDFMVPEGRFDDALNALSSSGTFSPSSHRIPLPAFLEKRLERARGATVNIQGLLDIDIYQDTTWSGWTCLDNEFIWKYPRYELICGVECLIPNPKADLLINLAHVIFCHGTINLLDFIYICSLLEIDDDLRDLRAEADRFCWGEQLDSLIRHITEIQRVLHSNDQASRASIRFPYLIPMSIIIGAHRGVARAANEGFSGSLSNWLNVGLKIPLMAIYRRADPTPSGDAGFE